MTEDDLAEMKQQRARADGSVYVLSLEEEASLAESLAQAERGEFASDAEVAAVWARHGMRRQHL